MEVKIENVITEYYKNSIKNNLEYLNILTRDEILFLASVFEKKEYTYEDDKEIFKIFDSLKNLSRTQTDNVINILFSDDVFKFVDKQIYQKNPVYTEKNNNLFLRKSLYQIIIQLLYKKCKQTHYFKKTGQKKTFFESEKMVEEKLKRYQNVFIHILSLLKNKYDDTGDYIHPIINNDKKIIKYTKLDYGLAGNLNLDKIKIQLEDMSKNNIGKIYDKQDIVRLEELFENNKINKLIAKKEIKLGNNFTKLIENILREDSEDSKKYFKELFDVSENKYLTNNDIYEMYKNEPNKEVFIKYLVEKTILDMFPKNNFNETEKVVSVVDKLFDKIIKTDYEHNSLNLKNEDIKFILMLETLNSIKTSNIGQKSNVTLNVYKDISSAEINGEKIKTN